MAILSTGYSDVIRIRAHHLLCMQGFQGYGYSPDFERNLEEVIHYLKSHPDCRIKVVKDVDIICQNCPHLNDGQCDRYLHSNSLGKMDLMVLKKLETEEGQIEIAQNLFYQVNEAFTNLKDIEDICGSCSWKDKCLWYSSRDPASR